MRLTRRPALAFPACSAFAGFRFPPVVIVLAVRWYLRFGLSYRDVEELLAERGIEVDHVTIHRWVRRFTPRLADAARFTRHRVGDRWYVDETYVKVALRGISMASTENLAVKITRDRLQQTLRDQWRLGGPSRDEARAGVVIACALRAALDEPFGAA